MNTGKIAYVYACDINYLRAFIKIVINEYNYKIYDAHMTSKQKILIVYLEDWVKIVYKSKFKEITFIDNREEFNHLLELIKNTDNLINILSKQDINLVQLENERSKYHDLIELYNIFSEQMKVLQLISLERYSGNYSHSPKVFIPFSKSLNRLSNNSLDIFSEDDLGRKKVETVSINDGIARLNDLTFIPKVRLGYINISFLKDNFKSLPEVWDYYKTASVSKQITPRRDFISDIYNLYKINCFTCETNKEKVIYMNYPFFLPYIVNNIDLDKIEAESIDLDSSTIERI